MEPRPDLAPDQGDNFGVDDFGGDDFGGDDFGDDLGELVSKDDVRNKLDDNQGDDERADQRVGERDADFGGDDGDNSGGSRRGNLGVDLGVDCGVEFDREDDLGAERGDGLDGDRKACEEDGSRSERSATRWAVGVSSDSESESECAITGVRQVGARAVPEFVERVSERGWGSLLPQVESYLGFVDAESLRPGRRLRFVGRHCPLFNNEYEEWMAHIELAARAESDVNTAYDRFALRVVTSRTLHYMLYGHLMHYVDVPVDPALCVEDAVAAYRAAVPCAPTTLHRRDLSPQVIHLDDSPPAPDRDRSLDSNSPSSEDEWRRYLAEGRVLEELERPANPLLRLNAQLFPHQVEAVRWMVRREQPGAKLEETYYVRLPRRRPPLNGEPHGLYLPREYRTGGLATRDVVLDTYVMECICDPDQPRGGIVADEMGLGKTLQVIATIMQDPYTYDQVRKDPLIDWLHTDSEHDSAAGGHQGGDYEGGDPLENIHLEDNHLECRVRKEQKLRAAPKRGTRLGTAPGDTRRRRGRHLGTGARSGIRSAEIGGELRFDEKDVRMGGTLVIAPVSVIGNWRDSMVKFTQVPEHLILEYHGAVKGKTTLNDLAKKVMVITSYAALLGKGNSLTDLHKIHWRRVVLDEAHEIRNIRAKRTKSILQLVYDIGWALTGTPIQNAVEDLLPLLKFIRVTHSFYTEREPSRTQHDFEHQMHFRRAFAIRTYILRRTKRLLELSGQAQSEYTATAELRLAPDGPMPHSTASLASTASVVTTSVVTTSVVTTSVVSSTSLASVAEDTGNDVFATEGASKLVLQFDAAEYEDYEAFRRVASALSAEVRTEFILLNALVTHMRLLSGSPAALGANASRAFAEAIRVRDGVGGLEALGDGDRGWTKNTKLIESVLDNPIIRQLIRATGEQEDDTLCPICYCEGVDAVTVCSHTFHRNCLRLWFEHHRAQTCPSCRRKIRLSEVVSVAQLKTYTPGQPPPETPPETPIKESSKIRIVADMILQQVKQGHPSDVTPGPVKVVIFSSFVRVGTRTHPRTQSHDPD
ncbi:SNF2 family amine-terminal domain protein [Gregarina niphandrodes]|uniref:SNF2 family amine-terminal domain protein n=1 Tax=Gregarina niphandrodes TaxID=110365 RepID=A0A023B3M9_GRENI|nr:SNF2 family amine-terminal domain protein [Gregarina niphandrodes]EZG55616.1 SNF2 family amine-terminal domain protein [Gregarina niphandrodes]|eukprot:XP_011131481.1 SNF2 family amine-terminal domain protein [Gregarina niphandrodes]